MSAKTNKILVCLDVKANKKSFIKLSIEELYSNLTTLDTTFYEVIHPDNNSQVKPYFDIDDTTNKINLNYITSKMLPFLNKLFCSNDCDWAISSDSRPKKSSFHLVLTTKSTTIN